MKIFFAHNSHNRPKTLINTISKEENEFPDTKFYISTTIGGTIKENPFNEDNKIWIPTYGTSWQLGCVNGFYSAISKACEENEDGIIIFSHDDVYLKDINRVKENINLMISENLSYIIRRPDIFFGINYFMMENVYLRIRDIRNNFIPHNNNLLIHESQINRDINNSTSAEAWLYSKIFDAPNGMVINYQHIGSTIQEINNHLVDNMGYEHINLGKNGWRE